MGATSYGLTDLKDIASGAAILASGGGDSFSDACSILAELAAQPGPVSVTVQDNDGSTNACVLAIMGSPDAAEGLTLSTITQSALVSDAATQADVQSAVLGATTATQVESLAGGGVGSLGGYSGVAMWPSVQSNGFTLSGRAMPQM